MLLITAAKEDHRPHNRHLVEDSARPCPAPLHPEDLHLGLLTCSSGPSRSPKSPAERGFSVRVESTE